MKRLGPKWLTVLLLVLLAASVLMGLAFGAVRISPLQIFGIMGNAVGLKNNVNYDSIQVAVFTAIRLPRVLIGALIGASLAVAGAAMQGLFRNPLADPALIGISSGASVAAVFFIVMSSRIFGHLAGFTGIYTLSLVTFVGALLSTAIVYRLSSSGRKIIVSMMLLAGIGVNAIAMAGIGIFTYAATDAQLRSITFWTLGSLGGTGWMQVWGVLPFALAAIIILPRLSKPLNALSLNESNAAHLGVKTESVKRTVMIVSALCVGSSVAVAGTIGFVGLLMPNIIRLIAGPDHRTLLPLSAIAGAILLVVADLISRTAFGAAELPVGILTALMGGPFFIYLLIKERRQNLA